MGYGYGLGYSLGRGGGRRSLIALLAPQSFGVEIVAAKLEPLIAPQSFGVEIVAVEGGAFNPSTDLTSPVAWFDMQDAGAFTQSGGVVTQVVNKISSVAWAEATNRPAYSATGLNGFPCCDHDGVNDKFMSTEAAVASALANQLDYYIAMVVAIDDLDAVEVIFSAADADAAGPGSKRWGTNTTGSGKFTAIGTNDASSAIVVDSTANTTTTPVLLEFYSISQATSIRINGGAEAPSGTASAYGTLSPDRCAIACRPSSTLASFYDGRWGEIIVCGNGNAANRAACATYLIDKWGIS